MQRWWWGVMLWGCCCSRGMATGTFRWREVGENCWVVEGLWICKRWWTLGAAGGGKGSPAPPFSMATSTAAWGPGPSRSASEVRGRRERDSRSQPCWLPRSQCKHTPKVQTSLFLTTLWRVNKDILSVAVVAICVRELMQHIGLLSVCTSGRMGRGFALCLSQENGRWRLNPVFWMGEKKIHSKMKNVCNHGSEFYTTLTISHIVATPCFVK